MREAKVKRKIPCRYARIRIRFSKTGVRLILTLIDVNRGRGYRLAAAHVGYIAMMRTYTREIQHSRTIALIRAR